MKGQKLNKEEYEVIAYPRLSHVQANVVLVVSRNMHVHRTMELGLVLEGEGVMRLKGNSFPVSKGSLYFFNAGEPHEVIARNPEGLKIAYLMVSSSFCKEYLSCLRNLEISQNDLNAHLHADQRYKLSRLFLEFMDNYLCADSDTYALKCISSICQIITTLLECIPYKLMSESVYLLHNKKIARLSRITEYIDINYGEKITLEELANRENVTKTYLSHFIHDNLNMTFQEYVSNVRFERALKLIRSTTMGLTDISVVCGFSDVKYLSRMLVKQFGMDASKCCSLLRQEVAHPAREEAQIFPTVDTSKNWLRAFWNSYMKVN